VFNGEPHPTVRRSAVFLTWANLGMVGWPGHE
jgi:hypothetical protein